MKEIQGNSFLVLVREGSSYLESITVMFLLVALLRMLRPKMLDIHCQLVIRTLTSPMGIICEVEVHWFLNWRQKNLLFHSLQN